MPKAIAKPKAPPQAKPGAKRRTKAEMEVARWAEVLKEHRGPGKPPGRKNKPKNT